MGCHRCQRFVRGRVVVERQLNDHAHPKFQNDRARCPRCQLWYRDYCAAERTVKRLEGQHRDPAVKPVLQAARKEFEWCASRLAACCGVPT